MQKNLPMDLTITPAAPQEKYVLRNLMELYLYDFSEFDDADLGPHGLYEYPYIDHYWTENDRHPFLVRVDEYLAGFALVCRHSYFGGEDSAWVIAEFFILRKYRGRGIGEQVAVHLLNLFPGPWQVGQIDRNAPATAFWRKIIARYTQGNYQEVYLDDENWQGPVQSFISSPGVEPPQTQSGE